jgi:cytochrome P450
VTQTDSHTPAEVLQHYDVFDPEQNRAKWELFGYAREQCPVVRTDGNGGFWLVTRYEDIRRILEDWKTFSSLESPVMPTGMKMCPIDADPPEQTALRQVLNPLFSRGALTEYVPTMRSAACTQIDSWIDRGTMEVLTEFSGPYVGKLLTAVLFPDLREDEIEQAHRIALGVAEEGSPEVFGELMQMCVTYLARAREKGIADSADDGVVKRLLTAEIAGRPITEEEQLGALAILFLGGLSTTRDAIGNIIYRTATNPGVEDRLRDRSWVKRDLDEFLRLDPPVACMARVATRDVELNGVLIRKGERLQLRYDSANRDENQFPGADHLVFGAPRTGHVAFGIGVHRCIGSNMARLQIEVAFEELLGRIKNLRLVDPAACVWVPGQTTALGAVNVAFDKVA